MTSEERRLNKSYMNFFKNIKNRCPIRNTNYVDSKHIILKLNKRNVSLIINSLAFTRRFLFYHNVEDVSVEIFFNKKNFEQDFFDLTFAMTKINEDCKLYFKYWKEYKIYK